MDNKYSCRPESLDILQQCSNELMFTLQLDYQFVQALHRIYRNARLHNQSGSLSGTERSFISINILKSFLRCQSHVNIFEEGLKFKRGKVIYTIKNCQKILYIQFCQLTAGCIIRFQRPYLACGQQVGHPCFKCFIRVTTIDALWKAQCNSDVNASLDSRRSTFQIRCMTI